MLSGKRELNLSDDGVEDRSAVLRDGEDHASPIDEDDDDPLLLGVEGDLVDDPREPRGLVTEQGVGAIDTFFGACVAVSEEERRERQALGTIKRRRY